MARVVIIGANKGIGLELARQLAARGDEVIAAVRQSSDDLSTLDVEVIEGVDVTEDKGVARLRDALGDRRIDVLIHNAGILTGRDETLETLDWDVIRNQFEVNTLGPLRVIKALKGALNKGAKIAIVSSRVASIADNTSGGNYGYRISKTAVNMAGACLAHELKSDGVTVILLHPGYVRTYLTGYNGQINPDEAARGLIDRIDDVTLDQTGSFWHANGSELPW